MRAATTDQIIGIDRNTSRDAHQWLAAYLDAETEGKPHVFSAPAPRPSSNADERCPSPQRASYHFADTIPFNVERAD